MDAIVRTRRGWTMIEVLIGTSIVGILLGLTLVGIQQTRVSARTVQSTNNLAQLCAATEQFASDHGGRLPPPSGDIIARK